MPTSPTTSDMGRLHEEHSAEIFGGTRSRGSGSTWKDQTDGYNGPDEPFSFRWDCKSTKAASISVSLATIEKVREQAQGHRWAIPLRIYGNDKLTVVAADLVALKDTDLAELLEAARSWVELETSLGSVSRDDVAALIRKAATADQLTEGLADAHSSLLRAGEQLAAQARELAVLRERQAAPKELAQWVPKMPWTVIHVLPEDQREPGSGIIATAVHYNLNGVHQVWKVRSVRVERTPANRPRLMVDDVIVRDGDLYRDGKLTVRVCEDDPSIEVG
jgi:hypothetical protein